MSPVTPAGGVSQRSLDVESHEQLYYQLYNMLFEYISNGTYKVGDLIPSETDLVKSMSVSRATVRKAMELLVGDGLVERRRGIGTVVVSNRPATAFKRVSSYVKRTTADAVTPVKHVVSATVVPASSELAERLEVEKGTQLFRLDRVRCSGDIAYYREIIHVVLSTAPGILRRDFSTESLRAYYTNVMHVTFARADQRVLAEGAGAETAKLLNIRPGSPLLMLQRVSFDSAGVPREYLQAEYRSDFYYLEMSLES